MGGYNYGVTNKHGEKILNFCAVMTMTLGSSSHL